MRHIWLLAVLLVGCSSKPASPTVAKPDTPTIVPMKCDAKALEADLTQQGFVFEEHKGDDPSKTWRQASKGDQSIRILFHNGQPKEILVILVASQEAMKRPDFLQIFGSICRRLCQGNDLQDAGAWVVSALELREKEMEVQAGHTEFPWIEFVGEIGDLELRCSRNKTTNVLRFIFQPITLHGIFRPGTPQ